MYDDDADNRDPSPYSVDESGPLWKETPLVISLTDSAPMYTSRRR